jgi:ATP-dependent helicase/nuclease subunit A
MSVDAADAVRITSIHRSKGLEYPVVVVADLGKTFNLSDLRDRLILDERYGLCPLVPSPGGAVYYPSLPYWLAARRQVEEILAEELRLLYVAFTRAQDRLLLFGSTAARTVETRWNPAKQAAPTRSDMLAARSALDWLGPWLAGSIADPEWLSGGCGASELFCWWVHRIRSDEVEEQDEVAEGIPDFAAGASEKAAIDFTQEPPPVLGHYLESAAWRYAHRAATNQPAKASVSWLRRRVLADLEEEASAVRFMSGADFRPATGSRNRSGSASAEVRLSAAELGTLHHLFLQELDLDQAQTVEGLRQQAARLQAEGLIDAHELAQLRLDDIANFRLPPGWTGRTRNDSCCRRSCFRPRTTLWRSKALWTLP